MKIVLLASVLHAAVPAVGSTGHVAGSKHDLSVTGPGEFRATSERNPCAFCHIPHGAGEKLGNRPDSSPSVQPFTGGMTQVRPGAPTGASRVCLSCHDGTIAPGRTRTGRIEMVGGERPLGTGKRSSLGTDLRGTHPISFRPGLGKDQPRPGDAVQLDRNGQVQCTSCHDPHSEWGDPELGMFLVKPNSGLCTSCHSSVAGTGQSGHFTSSALSSSDDRPGARSVGQAGCDNCHRSHHSPAGSALDRPGPTDDSTCLRCHDGSVARGSIAADVAKPSSHRATRRGGHKEDEGQPGSADSLPERSAGRARHVACVDCHDPHLGNSNAATAPAAPGALAGQWGIGIDGQRVASVRFEYEVCLKCHGDSANQPVSMTSRTVRRATSDTNLRRVFDPGSPSYHPVAAPGRNPNVPSLIPPLTALSQIYCSDCHSSDTGASGAGARGPHGSIYPFMLERQYLTTDRTPEGPLAYALCYKCHDRARLLSADSPFPHQAHVEKSATPCAACHDAHGVSSFAGNAQQNAHLVSFDLDVVKANTAPAAEYQALGQSGGSCNLTCHARSHDATNSRY